MPKQTVAILHVQILRELSVPPFLHAFALYSKADELPPAAHTKPWLKLCCSKHERGVCKVLKRISVPGLKINGTLLLQIHDNYALAWQNISSKFWWLKHHQKFPGSPGTMAAQHCKVLYCHQVKSVCDHTRFWQEYLVSKQEIHSLNFIPKDNSQGLASPSPLNHLTETFPFHCHITSC